MNTYRQLNPDKTIHTIRKLEQRIRDRFPDSGLAGVCHELLTLAQSASHNIEAIQRPRLGLRLGLGGFIALVLAGLLYSMTLLDLSVGKFDWAGLVQIFEALVNDLVLIGAALFFLFTLENRLKRRKALKALHELRAVAHVIDMHQLTKDPFHDPNQDTPHSPDRKPLDPYLLFRYLGYASEMLALTGKVAALYAQSTDDGVVMEAINEIEDLTTGLSRKIWQKMPLVKENP